MNFKLFKSRLFVVAFLVITVCLGFSPSSHAQNLDSKGTEFWLTFPGNLPGGTGIVLTLFISSETNTSGTVSIPGLAFTAPFTTTVGNVTTLVIPTTAELTTSDVVNNRGIHITALQEVTVYGLNRRATTTDAFLALPTDVLGSDYINLGYKNVNIVNATQLAIVATQNATSVTITPTVTTGARTAGVPYTLTMNQGETYMLRNTGAGPADLSGTIIIADKPIGVFGGHQCANIPSGSIFACDFIIEQLPPTSAWGKNFVTIPLKTRLNGDTYRFMASTNNTVVQLNGSTIATLNRGQLHEAILTGYNQITADKPILVAQYSNGTTYDDITSDPFMMLIFPYEQFLNSYTVTTPATGFSANFINVAAPNAAIGAVKLDNVVIPAGAFTSIGATGFSGAQLTVGLGVHTLGGTNLPFGVFVYGFDFADSYGYPGGGSFSPIALVTTLDLTPATGNAAINTNQCWDALVKDQNNNPLSGVRVDFTITGPNSSNTGFALTNASGIAHFCYTGTVAGDDAIVASVGTVTDNATFTWTDGCNINVTAKKFYDLNTNGLDDDNLPVENWAISLSGTDENSNTVGPINQLTGADGTTAFTPLAKGSYTVTEGNQSGWVHTTATSANLTLTTCVNPATVLFGNVCLGAGRTGGGGLGFWTNKNGQALLTGSSLCELNALCLRNADGSNYDPISGCPAPSNQQVNAGKTSLKNWLLNAYATNMSYMLSAQLAALKLNVLLGYVDGTRLIYAPGTSSANAAGFASVNDVMAEANTLLCANGVITAGNPLRARAEAVKNALEGASSNNNFVQLQPCPVALPTNATTQNASRPIVTEKPVEVNALWLVKASPNPSKDIFSLTIISDNRIEGITLRVIDFQGRVIETRNGLRSGQTIQVGNNLRPGTYLIETVQGKDRRFQTVIKQ